MAILTKICGLSSEEGVAAAVEARADYLGFVFYPPSPRHVSPERAEALAAPARAAGRALAAVTVDADDAALDRIMETLAPDLIQLHGHETPERVEAVRLRTGAQVMRALRIREARDLHAAEAFQDVADWLMFDAAPPPGAVVPGGHGLSFEAALLAGRRFARPWFLAGGLRAQTLADAVQASGARAVDVSSGVEDERGVKSPARIAAFLQAARAL